MDPIVDRVKRQIRRIRPDRRGMQDLVRGEGGRRGGRFRSEKNGAGDSGNNNYGGNRADDSRFPKVQFPAHCPKFVTGALQVSDNALGYREVVRRVGSIRDPEDSTFRN